MIKLIINFVIWLVLSIITMILYRAGGMGRDADAKPVWMPMWMRYPWIRRVIIPFVSLGYLLMMWRPVNAFGWWMFLPAIGLNSASLSTYWDELFGYDNHWFHGFACGLSLFPLCLAGLPWIGMLIRSLVCAVAMGVWSRIISKDTLEEYGRGFIHTATIPIC